MSKLPRMTEWLLVSLLLLAAIYVVAPQQLGVSLYKLSLITTAAWVGYWIDRSLFPYARPDNPQLLVAPVMCAAAMLRRALIVSAAMLAASLGA
ncbi:MAG TPA: putative holin [Gallionella sp.]|nr:putative holin [Gallionella sp.]